MCVQTYVSTVGKFEQNLKANLTKMQEANQAVYAGLISVVWYNRHVLHCQLAIDDGFLKYVGPIQKVSY